MQKGNVRSKTDREPGIGCQAHANQPRSAPETQGAVDESETIENRQATKKTNTR